MGGGVLLIGILGTIWCYNLIFIRVLMWGLILGKKKHDNYFLGDIVYIMHMLCL